MEQDHSLDGMVYPFVCSMLWAHGISEASVGGRVFLSAVPSGRTQMEPAVFVTEI